MEAGLFLRKKNKGRRIGINKVSAVNGYLGEGSSRKESLRVGTMPYNSLCWEKRLISHLDNPEPKEIRERIEVKCLTRLEHVCELSAQLLGSHENMYAMIPFASHDLGWTPKPPFFAERIGLFLQILGGRPPENPLPRWSCLMTQPLFFLHTSASLLL